MAVIDLTTENFESVVQDLHNVLLEFFVPACPFCQKYAPEYEEIAQSLQDDSRIKVARVDISSYPEIAKTFGVTKYPSLKLIVPGKGSLDLQGHRDQDFVTEFVQENLNETVAGGEIGHAHSTLLYPADHRHLELECDAEGDVDLTDTAPSSLLFALDVADLDDLGFDVGLDDDSMIMPRTSGRPPLFPIAYEHQSAMIVPVKKPTLGSLYVVLPTEHSVAVEGADGDTSPDFAMETLDDNGTDSCCGFIDL